MAIFPYKNRYVKKFLSSGVLSEMFAFQIFPMLATCPAHIIPLDFISLATYIPVNAIYNACYNTTMPISVAARSEA
jgi:hypothetical protein